MFNPTADLGLIGVGLNLLGNLFGGGAASQAQNDASRKSAKEAEVMDEYLKDYKANRPTRDYLREAFQNRVAKPSRFTKAWGGQGAFYGEPEAPPYAAWDKYRQATEGAQKTKDDKQDKTPLSYADVVSADQQTDQLPGLYSQLPPALKSYFKKYSE